MQKLIVILILLLFFKMNAQGRNDFEAGIQNIVFGGIVGGLGAIINKKANEKTANIFLKGFGKGAFGGYLLFESKRMVRKFGETGNYNYLWPSKIVNTTGVSIIENASANRAFWERWHINIGFNRFEIDIKNKFKLSYRIMPFALSRALYYYGFLDFDESLKVGTFVFKSRYIKSRTGQSLGIASSNSILLKSNLSPRRNSLTIAHEIIHVYQYESFSGFNPFLYKPTSKLNEISNLIKIYNKIFYTDFNYLISQSLYSLNKNYDTNFFENEARYYQQIKH